MAVLMQYVFSRRGSPSMMYEVEECVDCNVIDADRIVRVSGHVSGALGTCSD